MMCSHCIVGFSALLMVCASASDAAAEPPLTIDEAVKLALVGNERAQKAPLRTEAAAGQLARARGAFLPTLWANASETGKVHADQNDRHMTGTGSAGLTLPLVNPSAFPLYAQAHHQLEAERWGALEDRRTLAFDAARTYLVALTSERLLQAAQRRLERARANQQDTEARAAAQLTSSNDVTRATVESATAAGQVAQAQGSLERAYLQLGFLLGRRVAGPLVAPEQTALEAQHGSFKPEELVRAAEPRRPDVKSAHERTEALRYSAKEPLYRLAPTLSATAQIRTLLPSDSPATTHDESALLTLSWTLYDAGVRHAERRTRLAQAESQALDERLLRRSIATGIEVALASLHAARENHRIAIEGVAAARRGTEETEILYRQGLARAIELTDANAAAYAAEVNAESARLNMEQGYLDLRQELGLGPLGDGPKGEGALLGDLR